MAKKRVKKNKLKAVKRKKVAKPALKSTKIAKRKKVVRATIRKIKLALSNLIIFIFLTLLFAYSSKISATLLYQNLFWLLALISGFVALAFLIVLLVLLLLRILEK